MAHDANLNVVLNWLFKSIWLIIGQWLNIEFKYFETHIVSWNLPFLVFFIVAKLNLENLSHIAIVLAISNIFFLVSYHNEVIFC